MNISSLTTLLLAVAAAGPALAGGAQAERSHHQAHDRDRGELRVVKPATSCAALSAVDLTAIGGTGSRVLTAQTETTEDGLTVCTVEGTLAPSIGFRVQLPTDSWTQRYLQVGCGGLCGRISLNAPAAEGCAPLEDGRFAIASTDMGHQGNGGAFGLDPQKRADFAHRGVHLTAQASKTLIEAFYGRQPAYSYFSGCSDGGREALVEAQRYPDDFDGIVAGAPAMNFQVQNSLLHGWQAQVNKGPDGRAVLLANRLPLLHAAVLAQCDTLDGHQDGLLSDPRVCSFDPASIQCAEGQSTAQCLTPAEVNTVRRLYAGPRDAETGERLAVGGPQPGSELGWAGVFVPETADGRIFSETIALDALRYLVFEQADPTFQLSELAFTAATFDRLRPRHPLFDSTNPDLSAFARKGGKLILWHGWSDQHISPINTIAYHEALQDRLGRRQVQTFERLYLVPGMYHCSGGEGPSEIDLLTPIMQWVERGDAPDAIVAQTADAEDSAASRQHAVVQRGRPVYPYPYVARYLGRGDPQKVSSYRRGTPLYTAPAPAWRGSDFYSPYAPREL